MVKDIKDYVSFDISNYLKELSRIVPKGYDFCFQQTLDFILPGVFLKMTGCLEHKIDMITMQLCIDNEQLKQSVLRGNSKIPNSSNDIECVIGRMKQLEQIFNGEQGIRFDKEEKSKKEAISLGLWNDSELTYEENIYETSLNSLKYIWENLNFSTYLVFEEVKFKNSDENKNSNNNKSNDKTKSNTTPVLYQIYNKSIRYRNTFAHNEESVASVVRRPSLLSKEDTVYDSWFYRFLSAIYVDTFLRKVFSKYLNTRKKHTVF
jgi:hypothetical protein